MSNCCSSTCPELDNPPTRSHMGIVQIIELVVMAIVAILCGYDLYNLFKVGPAGWVFWWILSLAVDVLIIAGLVFILMGLFASTASSQRIRIGIYCFFAGTIIDIVCVVWYLISGGSSVDQWLVNLLKAAILIVLAYFLWRQSKNI